MDTRMLLRDHLRRSRDWVIAIDELEKELEKSGPKPEQSERLYELARLSEDVVPERERPLALVEVVVGPPSGWPYGYDGGG